MDRTATNAAITVCLHEIRRRLEGDLGSAKVAEARTETGQLQQAVEVALGTKQLSYEASRLLDAFSLFEPNSP